MNLKLPSLLVVGFTLFFINHSVAQTRSNKQSLSRVVYYENVDEPLNSKELSQIIEVYGDKAEEDILSRPQRLKDVKNILRNRVEITQHPGKDLSVYKKLSQVPLFTAYISNLKRDSFSVAEFNPLKYQFNFYSKNSFITYYWVDNTNYLIAIKPQHQQL